MSQGSERISVRCGASFREAIEQTLALRNEQGGAVEEWTFTDFVLHAIKDKLNHQLRSRGRKAKYVIETYDVNGTELRRLVLRLPASARPADAPDDWSPADQKEWNLGLTRFKPIV